MSKTSDYDMDNMTPEAMAQLQIAQLSPALASSSSPAEVSEKKIAPADPSWAAEDHLLWLCQEYEKYGTQEFGGAEVDAMRTLLTRLRDKRTQEESYVSLSQDMADALWAANEYVDAVKRMHAPDDLSGCVAAYDKLRAALTQSVGNVAKRDSLLAARAKMRRIAQSLKNLPSIVPINHVMFKELLGHLIQDLETEPEVRTAESSSEPGAWPWCCHDPECATPEEHALADKEPKNDPTLGQAIDRLRGALGLAMGKYNAMGVVNEACSRWLDHLKVSQAPGIHTTSLTGYDMSDEDHDCRCPTEWLSSTHHPSCPCAAGNPNCPRYCKACGKTLRLENLYVDDGCPCNSRRGVNFDPKPCSICHLSDCVRPGHRLESIYGFAAKEAESAKTSEDAETWVNTFISRFTDMAGPEAGLVQSWLVTAFNAGWQARSEPTIPSKLRACLDEVVHGGVLVSSNECSPGEILIANANNLFYVDGLLYGYVARRKEGRENTETKLQNITRLWEEVCGQIADMCSYIGVPEGTPSDAWTLRNALVTLKARAEKAEADLFPDASGDWVERTKKARDKAGWGAWDKATEILDAAAGDMPQPWRNVAIALLAEHHPDVAIDSVVFTLKSVRYSINEQAWNHKNMMNTAIEKLEELLHVNGSSASSTPDLK